MKGYFLVEVQRSICLSSGRVINNTGVKHNWHLA